MGDYQEVLSNWWLLERQKGLLRALMDCIGHSSEGTMEEEEMKVGRPRIAGNWCLRSASWHGEKTSSGRGRTWAKIDEEHPRWDRYVK